MNANWTEKRNRLSVGSVLALLILKNMWIWLVPFEKTNKDEEPRNLKGVKE